MRLKVCAAAAAVLFLAACGGPKPESPSQGQKKDGGPPDTSNVTIEGDASEPVNKIAMQAIADLEQYWAANYPELYGKDFEPISGGYYAVTEDSDAPPCTTNPQEVAGNAFYLCSERATWVLHKFRFGEKQVQIRD